MKKILSVLLSLAFLFSPLVGIKSASAASFDLGNDNSMRTIVDTYSNFTIIDTNNPASMNGQITSFDYYASNTNPFRFVVVDSTNTVKWISDEIIPAGVGAQSFVLDTPVMVMTGYNIGMYFASTGTIPFEYGGDPASYTPNNNGLPVLGEVLDNEGVSDRTYSLVAHGDDTNCAVMTYVSDTTTTVVGDGNAVLVAEPYHPAWTASIPGATWIWKSSATLVDETVSFEKILNIPGNVMSATLDVAADNSYKVFVGATEVVSEPNWENFHLAGQDTYNVTSSLASGLQTLKMDVTNYGAFDVSSNPAGLMYKLTVNYCFLPVSINCPAAPSIASHYLKGMNLKPSSTTYKNVISMVAKKMGPQKNFDGKGACEKPAYDDAVKAFVDDKLL